MSTITLTLEATQENLRLISQLLLGEAPADQVVAPQEESKPAKKKAAKKKPAEKKPEPEAEAPGITKTQLRDKGLALTKAGKSDEMKAVFEEFGAAKLSEIKEEDYAAVMEKLEALS